MNINSQNPISNQTHKKEEYKQLNFDSVPKEYITKAFSNINTSFKNYYKNSFSYGCLLNKVEENLPEIIDNNFPLDQKKIIAHQLNWVAKAHLQKENQYSKIHLFFQRLGQLIQGHGFRSLADRGLELALKLSSISELDIYKMEFKNMLSELASKKPIPPEFIEKTNNLSIYEFIDIIRENSGNFKNLTSEDREFFLNTLNTDKKQVFVSIF